LGYLLYKHPGRVFREEMPFGAAWVFYPEATDSRCTAALLLDVDPVGLVRGAGATHDQYVNDRPYVASSLTAVTVGHVFRTAISGRSKDRPERVDEAMPLTASLAAVMCRGGERVARSLFEPLGYQVTVATPARDEARALALTISGRMPVRDLLRHLTVLIPVMDDAKHYYVDESEIEKLLARGEGWLDAHPQRDLIVRRYLRYHERFVSTAISRLRADDEAAPDPETSGEAAVEKTIRLADARTEAIVGAIRSARREVRRVLDVGCGEGRTLRALMAERSIQTVVGADVSSHALQQAERRLRLDRMSPEQRRRIELIQASVLYRDARFGGFDVIVMSEVIEHIERDRLPVAERVTLGEARPGRLIVTTPNRECNVLWDAVGTERLRHHDHRFEMTREEFAAWAASAASAHSYAVTVSGIGPEDAQFGAPTQMAVFDREDGSV
jgi:3' terminal RNA ribose 2'-O-methyltransferase Hen1